MELMGEAGVGCLIHYPVPPHQSRAYEDEGFTGQQFSVANALADSVLSIPIGPHISQKDAAQVARTLISTVRAAQDPTDQDASLQQEAA